MSTEQLLSSSPLPIMRSPIGQRLQPWRFPLLCGLLLCSLASIILLRVNAPAIDQPPQGFTTLWLLCSIPYLAACSLVLLTQAPDGRRRWLELGLILCGVVILRAVVLPLEPNLSHDSWRYLWDARVTLHGYSPYEYAPGDDILQPLQNILFVNSRFRNVPTLYPPGAQAIYLLSYLLAPDNLFFFKGLLIALELISTVAIAWLLTRKGLDPARCLIYAWCPLAVVEFGLQGHQEAITIVFTALALVCAYGRWRGSRILTGFFIAMAALTNIYPLLFLLVIVRRRDWALLITFCATVVLAYIPYLILGHGMVLGFFSSYASEQTQNESIVPLSIHSISALLQLDRTTTLIAGYTVDALVVGAVCWLLWRLRRKERISMEAGILALTGVVFAVASHVYPWYTTELLPWVALLIGPLWLPRRGLLAGGLAIVVAWYCALASVCQYYFVNTRDWGIYYLLVYAVAVLALALAGYAYLSRRYDSARTHKPTA